VAPRLPPRFDRWRRFDAQRQGHARSALGELQASSDRSPDTREVVDRALA